MGSAAPTSVGRVTLQGVNLSGWLDSTKQPSANSDLARLANWRFTHVRLPVRAATLVQPGGWAMLDDVLALCLDHRLRCVLALQFEQHDLFADETRWGVLVRRWESIARRYAGWPEGLLYELLDAPRAPDDVPAEALSALGAARLSTAAARRPAVLGATGGRAWSALAVKLTQAIRTVDERHALVVSSNDGGSAAAFAHLRPTGDPNTLYSFRFFEPAAFTMQEAPSRASPNKVTYPGVIGGEQWDRQRMQQALAPAIEFGRTYEAPLYLTAFGVAAQAPRTAQLTWLRSLLSLCHQCGIGWAYWTYRGHPFGLVCDEPPCQALPQYENPQRLDYELLGVLQSEA